MLNHINYDMMYQSGQSGRIGSCQIMSIMTWWVNYVSQVKLDNVKSYQLRHDGSVRSVRSNWIMWNHIDYDMMCQLGQSVQLDYVKSYSLRHDGSVRSVKSNWIMWNHVDYDMMIQLGQLVHVGSCRIISIMKWCVSQVS